MLFTGDHTCLRPAQHFIPAERDQRGARSEARAHHWLFDSVGGEVHQAARAEILEDGQPDAVAQLDQLVERRPLGEADDTKVRRMNAQQQARAFGNGALVIRQARAVCCPHLAQHRSAFRHDVGNAEAIADFNQFAPRDNHLAALGQRVQHQEDSGGVVVNDDGGLGAGQPGQQACGVNIALAASAGGQVVLQVRVLRGDLANVLNRRGG